MGYLIISRNFIENIDNQRLIELAKFYIFLKINSLNISREMIGYPIFNN